jgi:hypothetical protein
MCEECIQSSGEGKEQGVVRLRFRQYATTRKVAGSNPEEAIGVFR